MRKYDVMIIFGCILCLFSINMDWNVYATTCYDTKNCALFGCKKVGDSSCEECRSKNLQGAIAKADGVGNQNTNDFCGDRMTGVPTGTGSCSSCTTSGGNCGGAKYISTACP